MASKTNIRSIRFSDELAELIDRQAGSTFTEKFERLITRCVWELPQKEEELADIQQRINQERKRLKDIQKRRIKLDRARVNLMRNCWLGHIEQFCGFRKAEGLRHGQKTGELKCVHTVHPPIDKNPLYVITFFELTIKRK